MNRRIIIPIVVFVVICVGVFAAFFLVSGIQAPAKVGVAIPSDMAETAADLHSTIETTIASIVGNMEATAAMMPEMTTVAGQESVLRTLYNQYPQCFGVSYTDISGSVSVVVPKYSLSDVSHLMGEQQITESSFTETALLVGPLPSNIYGEVICILVPVYTADGLYAGYLTLVAYPSVLLGAGSGSLYYYKDTQYNAGLGDPDGTIIYYPDSEVIGTNVYTSGLFHKAGAVNQLAPIFEMESGTAEHTFYDVGYGPMVDKLAVWSTVHAAGRDIRVLLLDSSRTADQKTSVTGNPDLEEMVSTVEQMLVYAKKNGKDRTLTEISNPDGQFASENFSIFSYDMEGTVLADPGLQALIGEDRINYRDGYGMRLTDSMITRCLQGGGYIHTYTPVATVAVTNAAEIDLAYVLPVDDTWFIGARQTVSPELYSVNLSKRGLLFRNVQDVQQYILNHGKEAALAEINDPAGQFNTSGSWVFAMDYSGRLLADPAQPQMVGSDYLYFTDPHGSSTVREMLVLAKNGGGFTYRELPVAYTDQHVLQLVYVEPVDDTWYLGSITELNTFTGEISGRA
jgi:hypothetical protein